MPRKVTAEERNSIEYQRGLDEDEKSRQNAKKIADKYGNYKSIDDHDEYEAETKAKKHKKKSKPSLLEALTEAHKDNLISKSMFEKYKKDIDEGDTKAVKSRLKSYDYPFEEDDEPIEKYVSVENYEGIKKTRGRPKKEKVAKEKLKPVTLVEIGHELNTRTRKEKMSPEKKREIYDFVMKF